MRTVPPGKYIVLYDGMCGFCTAQSRRLVRLARTDAVQAMDFQQPEVLDQFPGITHEQCMEAMHLVTPNGKVYRGVGAIVQALATRRLFAALPWMYGLPCLGRTLDWIYGKVAAARYRLGGSTMCEHGTCRLPAQRVRS